MAEYKQLGAYGALCGLHDLRHGYIVRRVSDLGSFQALGNWWVSIACSWKIVGKQSSLRKSFFQRSCVLTSKTRGALQPRSTSCKPSLLANLNESERVFSGMSAVTQTTLTCRNHNVLGYRLGLGCGHL